MADFKKEAIKGRGLMACEQGRVGLLQGGFLNLTNNNPVRYKTLLTVRSSQCMLIHDRIVV